MLAGLLTRAVDDISRRCSRFLRVQPRTPQKRRSSEAFGLALARHRHRAVLKAVNHHWQSDAELRELWLGIAERFVAAGADEIERERAVGKIAASETGRTLACLLFRSTERALYIAGQGIEPAWSDEEAAVGPLVKLWHSTLYG